MFRRSLRRHPERWPLAIAASAWIAIVVRSIAVDHAGHTPATLATVIGGAIVDWTTMAVAMMVPSLIVPIREVAARSFWNRRHRAVAAFLAGYVSIWILFGVVAAMALSPLPSDVRLRLLPVLLLAAAAWQLSPLKWRAVMACHRRITLAPDGWAATRDCVRQGWAIGSPCVVACGPMMAAGALTHDVRLMAVIAAIVAIERAAFRPRPRLTMAALASLAAVVTLAR